MPNSLISHNPYFTGNSFAINLGIHTSKNKKGHNPYFTGNSFAIWQLPRPKRRRGVTILILLETPLQSKLNHLRNQLIMSQSLFYWKLLCNKRTNRI